MSTAVEARKKAQKTQEERKHGTAATALNSSAVTNDFRPNELLKEMGFDISPSLSSLSRKGCCRPCR